MPSPEITMRDFIRPLAAVFGDPTRGEPSEFYASLCDHLTYTPADVLPAAAKHLQATKNFWPSIAECRDAVGKIMADRVSSSPIKVAPGRWSEEAAVAFIRKRAAGAEALAGGWHVALVEFVQDRHRLPDEAEKDEMRSAALRVDKKMREASGPMLAPIVRALRAKRLRIAEALCEVAA